MGQRLPNCTWSFWNLETEVHRHRDIWGKMVIGIVTSGKGPDSHSPWMADATVIWADELVFYYT